MSKYVNETSRHLFKLEYYINAGLHHTLAVDAPNWGQDWSNTMRDGNGPTAIFNADPDKNVIFSIHMYDV